MLNLAGDIESSAGPHHAADGKWPAQTEWGGIYLCSVMNGRRGNDDDDSDSNFIAMNYINHITRDIHARLIEGK